MINKEIEEMAKAICSACDDGVATCNRKPCSLAIEEATAVFNLGYRKIDKDSVVLKIKELEDTCNKCHWVTDYKILKYHEEEVIKLSEQEVKQVSKETARDIYKMGEEFYKMTYHKSNALPRLLEWIKDTFDVEIKEYGVKDNNYLDEEIKFKE